MKIYHGIIVLRHTIGPRRMVLLKEECAEYKKGGLLYCCNQVWMKNGGLILWNASVISEMSKTTWQMGKHFMKDDMEKDLKYRSFRSEQWLDICQSLQKTSQGSTNLAARDIHRICINREEDSERSYSGRRH